MDDEDKTDYRRALEAIYSDAYRRGHLAGFKAGIAEREWLNRHWPMIALGIGLGSMVAGIFVGAQTPN